MLQTSRDKHNTGPNSLGWCTTGRTQSHHSLIGASLLKNGSGLEPHRGSCRLSRMDQRLIETLP